MRFLTPAVFWLLPALLVAAYLLWRIAERSAQLIRRWFAGQPVVLHRPWLRNALRAGALAFTLLGAAGPYFERSTETTEVLGRQVMFLLDVSASMNAPDLRPSRLARAKGAIGQLADTLQGDQLGLMVFTNYAYLQCPLTTDVRTLRMFLDIVETSQFANTGTDLRESLRQAAGRFAAPDKAAPEARRTARAIVLFTDGEDYGQRFQSVLADLRRLNISLVVVGVGTEGGAPVPQLGSDGRPVGTKKDRDGQQVVSRLAKDKLTEAAATRGSQLFFLDSEQASMEPIARALRALPAAVMATRTELAAIDRYQWLLLPAALCLLASLFLSPARRAPEGPSIPTVSAHA